MSKILPFEQKFTRLVSTLGVRWEEIYLDTASGRQRCVNLLPSDPKAIVLFFHATGNDALFPNVGLFETLINANYAVVAPDLPGHGRTSGAVFSLVAVNDLVRSINSHLSTIMSVSYRGTLPVYGIGQSLGAVLLIAASSENTLKNLSGLITIAMPSKRQGIFSFLNELTVLFGKELYTQRERYPGFDVLPALLYFKRDLYPLRLPKGSAHYMNEILTTIERLKPEVRLQALALPCLQLFGAGDRIAPAFFCPSSQVETSIVSAQTHFTMMFSDQCSQKCLTWLQAQYNDQQAAQVNTKDRG